MTLNTVVPYGTLFRVWLRCEHLLDLPESFNTVRYLGVDKQQDFEYIEKFRIENLASNAMI